MENRIVAGKTIRQWMRELPLLENMIRTEEVFWPNPNICSFDQATRHLPLGERDVKEAEERLARFAPYIAKAFPETRDSGGIIESPLIKIPKMQRYLEEMSGQPIEGEVWLKCDSHLPISGSIKARGGFMRS